MNIVFQETPHGKRYATVADDPRTCDNVKLAYRVDEFLAERFDIDDLFHMERDDLEHVDPFYHPFHNEESFTIQDWEKKQCRIVIYDDGPILEALPGLITLNMYVKATSAAQAVEDFRSCHFIENRGGYLELCEKLGGIVVFNDREDDGRISSSIHLFSDGSAYYDDDSGNYPLENLREFIESREAMIEEQTEFGPIFSDAEKAAVLAEIEPLRTLTYSEANNGN